MRILYQPNCYSQQRQREKKANIYPVRMAMEAEWYRQQGHDVDWGTNPLEYPMGYIDRIISEPEGLPFLKLPAPDRVFTRAKEYTSGNYKYMPGTHILSASGCHWGKCTFCVEKGKPYEVRSVDDVVAEIKECKRLGFREIFDDSATFPVGDWLFDFCHRMKPLNMRFSCNMRLGVLKEREYSYLENAGCRMLLYGLESANQMTLGYINKGIYVDKVIDELRLARCFGIEPHIAVMFGFPNELDEHAMNTLRFVHYLLRKGYAKTAQASLYVPFRGEPDEDFQKYVHKIYNAAFYPDFWFNQLKDIRNLDDIKYIWKGIKSAI